MDPLTKTRLTGSREDIPGRREQREAGRERCSVMMHQGTVLKTGIGELETRPVGNLQL